VISGEMQFQAVAGKLAVPRHHSSIVAAEMNIKSTKQIQTNGEISGRLYFNLFVISGGTV